VDHAHNQAERGGFSRAVSAENPDDLFRMNDEADVVDDDAAAVGLHELGGFEQIHR
jgi:hypothetical protein